MYSSKDPTIELRAAGLEPEDYADYVKDVECLPENWRALDLFLQLKTQWRIGFQGKTGLDYGAVYGLLDRQCGDAWNEIFDDIRTLESAALEAMAEAK